MKYLLALAIALSILPPAQARIGETREQCIARYGKPTSDETAEPLTFFRNGWQIKIRFFGGKADQILFIKALPGQDGEKISDNEKSLLINSNGGGKKWKQIEGVSSMQGWATEDGELICGYDPFDPYLYVITKDRAARNEAEKAGAEAKKLKGF